jgi:uncharacterized alpha-E superfamily protein
VFHCLTQAHIALHEISGNRTGYVNEAERRLGSLKSMLEYNQVQDIMNKGLHEFIDDLQIEINEISDAIQDTFFFTDKTMQ